MPYNTPQEIIINSKLKLSGTLTFPTNRIDRVPAILFIHGSGKVDRDENTPKLQSNIFKDLSNEMVKLGFATLRYDKRGCGKSEGVYEETGFWDLVDDAENALILLRNQEQIDPNKIILLGHSEGCSIAPAVSERLGVQGMILISGFRGNVFDSTNYQTENVISEISKLKGIRGLLLRLIASPKKIIKQNIKLNDIIMNSNKPVITIRGQKINAKWYREHKLYNVDSSLANIKCPLLAVVGSKDVQVRPIHTKMMGDIVKCPFEYHIINEMNHMLRNQIDPITMLDLKKIYLAEINDPIEPKLINILQKWLAEFI